MVSEEGPDHDKNFTAIAMLAGQPFSEGSGKTKREAEQVAARAAYELLKTSFPQP